jgi:hypothetical protein
MTLIDFPSKPELLRRLDEVASGWPIHASPDLGKPYGNINGKVETFSEGVELLDREEWAKAIKNMEKNDLARYKEGDSGLDAPATRDATNPTHYKHLGVECIQMTEHMSFCLGNVVKYVYRCNLKGGVEDLKKARWYLDREIARRETAE